MFPKKLSDYLAKIVKFSCKNRQIFLQKLLNFPVKSSYFPAEYAKFFCKNFQTFLQRLPIFFRASDPEDEKSNVPSDLEETIQK